ncbi:MAG TPA: hypothetical protein VM598_11600, partial [Bdellovibrionota bacterium]|nr:hypothetical protein [Bdellovibrionota bacterium]
MGRHSSLAIVVSILALAVAVARPASAGEDAKPQAGSAWVLVFPGNGTPRWKARALQEFIAQHLGGMERIRLADEVSLQKLGCLELETDCIVAALRTRGVQIFLRGSVEGDRLQLESRETWTGDPVASRTVRLGHGIAVNDFRHRVFRLIRPFTEIGGLLDQHPPPVARETGPVFEAPPVLSDRDFWRLASIAGALARRFWVPCFVTRRRVLGLRWWLAGISLALPLALFACVHLKTASATVVPVPFLPLFTALKYGFGGALWASILLIAHRFSFSALRGLERVSYFTIVSILRAWLS